MTTYRRLAMAVPAMVVRAMLLLTIAAAASMAAPSGKVAASAPPTTEASGSGPVANNDLLPDDNNLTDCVGTVERANCGSKARADGHTYLVFLALIGGLAFIGWRIARGVKARDAAYDALHKTGP